VLATAPLHPDDWLRIGWGAWDGFTDDLDRIAYAARTPGGRLLLGGGGNPAYSYRFGGQLVNGLLEGFMSNLQEMFPHITVGAVYFANIIITLFVVALLFAIIFKVLPDAIIHWKDVVVGSLFTAGLFMIGKFCLTLYIHNSDLGSTYGSAGSLVILLLWVYYSSIVLYFGAEFTKAYSLKYGGLIKPKPYATTVKVVQVESNKISIQQNESGNE
jgi:membrane protein